MLIFCFINTHIFYNWRILLYKYTFIVVFVHTCSNNNYLNCNFHYWKHFWFLTDCFPLKSFWWKISPKYFITIPFSRLSNYFRYIRNMLSDFYFIFVLFLEKSEIHRKHVCLKKYFPMGKSCVIMLIFSSEHVEQYISKNKSKEVKKQFEIQQGN